MEITFPLLRRKVKCVIVKAAFHHYCDGFCKIKTKHENYVWVSGYNCKELNQCQTELPWAAKGARAQQQQSGDTGPHL